MNSLDLENALQRYTDALTKLEALTVTKRKRNEQNATEIVLDVLVTRDRIQSLLAQTCQNPKKTLLRLSELFVTGYRPIEYHHLKSIRFLSFVEHHALWVRHELSKISNQPIPLVVMISQFLI